MEDNLLARVLSGLRPGRGWLKIVLLTVLLTLAICSFAGGQGEDPIAVAKALIEEKKYDEAVKILAEVVFIKLTLGLKYIFGNDTRLKKKL